MTVRVLIADDHPIVRAGIRSEFAGVDGYEIVGEALNGDDALALAQALRPDVLLLDVNMPGLKALRVLQALKNPSPTCRVLVLTAYRDPGTVLGFLRAGADGYILKDEDPALIVDAVRAVVSGGRWISLSLEQMVAAAPALDTRPLPGAGLTGREQEVLRRLVQGGTNRQIAAEMQTTERTVEFHISNILAKLGVASRLEAALWAREHL